MGEARVLHLLCSQETRETYGMRIQELASLEETSFAASKNRPLYSGHAILDHARRRAGSWNGVLHVIENHAWPKQATPQSLDFYVFDLDGTLWTHNKKPDWNDASTLENVTAIPRTCKYVQQVQNEGAAVYFVTGRHDKHRELTLRQITAATSILQPALFTRPNEAFGMDTYTANKVQQLREIALHGTYVGDLDADREIARNAGWKFMHVHEVPEC